MSQNVEPTTVVAFLARAAAELNASLDYKQPLASVAHLAVPAIADFCTVDVIEGSGRSLPARRLRALPFATALKLVAISGYGQVSDRERTRAAGIDEHLVKPVSIDQVKAVLNRLLGIEETQ